MTQPSVPAPVSASPARPQRRRQRFLLVVFLGVLAALWLGSVQKALRDHVRNPYPKTQNGLVFVAEHSAHNPAIASPVQEMVQWVNHRLSGGAYVAETDYASVEIGLPPGTTADSFSAVARASNGDTFGLRCETLLPGSSSFTSPSHFFVSLTQAGVPDNYRWLDITVDDKKGHRGTWRISDLPHLKHALLPATPLHETAAVQNVSLQARAWWDGKAAPPDEGTIVGSVALPVVAQIKAVVPSSALARPSQSWGVDIVSLTQEWEDPDRVPFAKGGSNGYSTGSSGHPVSGAGTAHAEVRSAVAPHPSAQHIAQIDARLTQYDAVEETATFRNVFLEPDGKGLRVRVPPGGLFLTTPSGVRVALHKPQPLRPNLDEAAKQNEVRVAFGAEALPLGLSPSPLQKRVGPTKPPRLNANVDFTGDGLVGLESGNEPSGSDIHFTRLKFSHRLQKPVLPTLVVHVTQEATLQSVPITFIVPVKAGKPKQDWGN